MNIQDLRGGIQINLPSPPPFCFLIQLDVSNSTRVSNITPKFQNFHSLKLKLCTRFPLCIFAYLMQHMPCVARTKFKKLLERFLSIFLVYYLANLAKI